MSNGNIRDFDEITSFLGDYGLFQILVMVLLSVSTMPAGYMGVIVVFVSDTPEHYCRSPNSSSRNGTEWEQENGFHDRGSWMGPGSCSRYKLNENWTEKAAGFNDTEQCLDGWVFSTDKYTTTIVSEVQYCLNDHWQSACSTRIVSYGCDIKRLRELKHVKIASCIRNNLTLFYYFCLNVTRITIFSPFNWSGILCATMHGKSLSPPLSSLWGHLLDLLLVDIYQTGKSVI